MNTLKAKSNFTRICWLLVDKGAEALRRVAYALYPPSTLAAELNVHKLVLMKLQDSLITQQQWKLLFPALGTPDYQSFDITLLTIILRNIVLPSAVLNAKPPKDDTSLSIDILRIKIFRNEVYGSMANAQYDDTTFDKLWQEISNSLVKLGIPRQDIDEAKVAPLRPEEESYVEILKKWKELDDQILSKLNDVKREVNTNNVNHEDSKLRTAVKDVNPLKTDKLPEMIRRLSNKFQEGTRQWFFDHLSNWFYDEEQSRVMILSAGPGVGKSVLAAKVCEFYEQGKKLAAYHFCDFKNPDYSNPQKILRSLARQMCRNIDGFCDNFPEILRCENSSPDSLSEEFRVLLKDPLHALDRQQPVLIVVDALDESKSTDVKSDLLEFISREFSTLPQWVKILITCRQNVEVRKMLHHFDPVEVLPADEHLQNHTNDIQNFIMHCLPNLDKEHLNSFIRKCDGSFLYASYLVSELKTKGLEFPTSDSHAYLQNEEAPLSSARFVTTQEKYKGKVMKTKNEHNGKEKKILDKKNSKKKALLPGKSVYSSELSAISRLRELENEIRCLKKQNDLLQIKHEEILVELGELTVKNTAKESEEKKSKLFEQIFGSQITAGNGSAVSVRQTSDDKKSFDVNGAQQFPNQSNLSIVSEGAACEQPLLGATSLMRQNNDQPEMPEIVKNDKARSGLGGARNNMARASVKGPNDHQTTTNGMNSPPTTKVEQEKNSMSEITNLTQYGNAQAANDLPPPSSEECEHLSLSVQQDNSEIEYISLSNKPPPSVATTVYNNYKLLLMFIAQRLLLSDVSKLKDWARQNFSIINPENSTDILFQLDQKGFINASDLRQIRDFFESITRIDLVYIIDAFLLGDYSLLRQNPEAKRREENRSQNPRRNVTTKQPNISNSGNNSRDSLVGETSGNQGTSNNFRQSQRQSLQNSASTHNPTHFAYNSPNKNNLMALEQRNNNPTSTRLAPTKITEVVVADSLVASKLLF